MRDWLKSVGNLQPEVDPSRCRCCRCMCRILAAGFLHRVLVFVRRTWGLHLLVIGGLSDLPSKVCNGTGFLALASFERRTQTLCCSFVVVGKRAGRAAKGSHTANNDNTWLRHVLQDLKRQKTRTTYRETLPQKCFERQCFERNDSVNCCQLGRATIRAIFVVSRKGIKPSTSC